MELIWKERKRLVCGLPWTFTKYSLSEDRLFVETGFLNQRQDEVQLYRVLDVSVTRNLIQRIFGLGTIHVKTSDKSLGNFDLINIQNVRDVKETIVQLVEDARDRKRVSSREFIVDSDDADDNDLEDNDL